MLHRFDSPLTSSKPWKSQWEETKIFSQKSNLLFAINSFLCMHEEAGNKCRWMTWVKAVTGRTEFPATGKACTAYPDPLLVQRGNLSHSSGISSDLNLIYIHNTPLWRSVSSSPKHFCFKLWSNPYNVCCSLRFVHFFLSFLSLAI